MMDLDRREFLRTAVAVPVAAATRTLVARQPAFPLDKGFAVVSRLADGVYGTIAANGPQCVSNGGILVGRAATLLVEGHFQPAGAALEIDVARMLSDRPIRGAVDTHYHLDHTFGNAAYAKEHVPILAHARAAELMRVRYAETKGRMEELVGPLERHAAGVTDATRRERAQSDVNAAKWLYGAVERADLAYPTELLSPADMPKQIDLGGLTAVIDAHPGHTPTDLVVAIPERNVLFAGDLLFYESYPVCFDADMVAWRRVLDWMSRQDPQVKIVPGHGPVCGLANVRTQMELFDDLQRHAADMRRAGVGVDEAAQRYQVPPQFKSYEIFSWDWSIGAAMRSYYAAAV